MFFSKIDDFLYKNAELSKKLDRFLVRFFKVSRFSDAAMCVCITLTAAFCRFEHSLAFYDWVRTGLDILLPLIWAGVAFGNGFRRRKEFVLFFILYWVLPQFPIVWLETLTDFSQYSMPMGTLVSVCRILVRYPVEGLADFFGVNNYYMAGGIAVLSELAFLAGFMIRNVCKRSEWYCDFRNINLWIK